MSRDWLLYLDDLIDSAEKVQRFLKGLGYDGFASDPQIVWEAATHHVPRILDHAKQLRERFDRGDDSST